MFVVCLLQVTAFGVWPLDVETKNISYSVIIKIISEERQYPWKDVKVVISKNSCLSTINYKYILMTSFLK